MAQSISYLVLLVLAGYWCRARMNSGKLDFLSKSNYVIFYESAITGGVFFACSCVVLGCVKLTWDDCEFKQLMTATACGVELVYPVPYADSVLMTWVFAHFFPLISNRFVDLTAQLTNSSRDSGLIPSMILDALDDYTLLEITTFRRKSYIGWIRTGPGISKEGRMMDVAILPLQSGYRDKSDLTLHMTTDYANALDKRVADILEESWNQIAEDSTCMNPSKKEPDEKDLAIEEVVRQMSVVIPLTDIASIRPYDFELRDVFDNDSQ